MRPDYSVSNGNLKVIGIPQNMYCTFNCIHQSKKNKKNAAILNCKMKQSFAVMCLAVLETELDELFNWAWKLESERQFDVQNNQVKGKQLKNVHIYNTAQSYRWTRISFNLS